MTDNFQALLLKVSTDPSLDGGDLLHSTRLLIEAALKGLNIHRAGIWLWSEDRNGIECELVIDSWHQLEVESLLLQRQDFPNYFAALDKERVIAADDAHQHPSTNEFSATYLTPLGINSMLDVPLRYKGNVIGILCCEHIGPARVWRETDISFASGLADLYGRAKNAANSLLYQRQLEANKAELEQTVKARTQQLEENLSRLKATQQQLIESEKMAALGNLVAGVAHEINNPLGVAITAVTAQQESLKKLLGYFNDDSLSRQKMQTFFQFSDEALGAVTRNLERAATLVRNFKKTAVDQFVYDKEMIDLADYIEMVTSNLRPLGKQYQVKIRVICEGAIPIRTFPGAIAQILSNLVLNACIHGFAGRGDREDNQVSLCATIDAPHVVMRITDNGNGMSAKVLANATQPFFTTRRHLGGSGLGLSIVYNLVNQQLKGQFTIQSDVDRGTCVVIRLPMDVDRP